MEENDKQREQRLREAERIHDRDFKGMELHSKQIEAFSVAAMRAPALVAAGGVAASLGFYSANYVRLVGKAEALSVFNESLYWLLVGLFFTLLSPGLAYLSQLAYSDSIASRIHRWQHPYSVETRRSKFGGVVGDIFRWACVVSVILSIAAVAIGGVRFLNLVAVM